jgi:hypothetical protein
VEQTEWNRQRGIVREEETERRGKGEETEVKRHYRDGEK